MIPDVLTRKIFQHLKKNSRKLFFHGCIATPQTSDWFISTKAKKMESESLQNKKLLTTPNLTLILMEMKFKLNYIKPFQHFPKKQQLVLK
jgi:hypothetical protein